jgi:peptide/nickel transport system permease protein
MLSSIIQRLAQGILVMLGVALIAFAIFNYVGDPINNMVGGETSIQDREKLRSDLGLDAPFFIQYLRFVGNAARGNFGVSYQHGRPVHQLIMENLPATVELSLVAMMFALVVGLPIGIYTALHRDSPLSRVFMAVSLIGVSLPTFLIGILLILVFSVTLGLLPSNGRGEVVAIGWWTTGFLTASGLKSLILPSITLGLFQMALIVRLVRSEMLEVLGTDYIRFARARGLTSRSINFGHALINTLVPVITMIGIQFGNLIAFSIITETVFQWPGMGFLFIQAIQFADIPVMAGYLVMIAFMFVMLNLVVDTLYEAIDPRLRPTKD